MCLRFSNSVSRRLLICKFWHTQLRNYMKFDKPSILLVCLDVAGVHKAKRPHVAPVPHTSVSIHIWSRAPAPKAMILLT